MSFADATTETLHAVRANLLAGLDKVAARLDAGTFHTGKKNGAAPPSQSGQTTLALLNQIDAELDRREHAMTATTGTEAPNIGDLFDLEFLEQMLAAKYIKRQYHPTEPLAILNYTDSCMWDRAWNPVTLACRGIIHSTDTGEVVARSFGKFFNYGEPSAPPLDLAARAVVTDKADGSLGILYPVPSGGYAIATRGSFASEQARHATDLLHTRYAGFTPTAGVTLLFEIVYPDNRIVLDYCGLDDLLFLGAVDTATGRSLPGDPALYGWTGPAVETFEYATLAAALEAPPRENAEGLVVHFVDTDERCKIKQADYMALHRVLTGTSARTLWQFLAVNACAHLIQQPKHWGTKLGIDPDRAAQILEVGPEWLDTLIARVPDEFYDWVKATIEGLTTAVERLGVDLDEELRRVKSLVNTRTDHRKAFAALVAGHPHIGAMFLLLDGRDITTYLWKHAYPAAERPWMNRSEDVA